MQILLIEKIYATIINIITFFFKRKSVDTMSIGLMEEVIALLKLIKTTDNTESSIFFDVKYCLGLVLLAENKFFEAGNVFLDLLKENPANPWVLFLNAEVFLCFKRYELANICIKKALEIMPNNSIFLYSYSKIPKIFLSNPVLHLNQRLTIEEQIAKINAESPIKLPCDTELYFSELLGKELKKIALTCDHLLSTLIQCETISILENCSNYQKQINGQWREMTTAGVLLVQYLDLTLESHKAFLNIHMLCYVDILQYNNDSIESFSRLLNFMETQRKNLLVFKAELNQLELELKNIIENFRLSSIQPDDANSHIKTPRLNF